MSGHFSAPVELEYLAASGMNYLGHLYLSGEEPLVIVGNFMADDVKGRYFDHHHPLVQRGIRLHRTIDSFTDAHPLQREGRARLRRHAGRYAGVVMDMFYDHLLARHWSSHCDESLEAFTGRMYRVLGGHQEHLPVATRRMLTHMTSADWLGSYATEVGLARALSGMAVRVPEGHVMNGAEMVLMDNMDRYTAEFDAFIRDIRDHLRKHRS
jgi:acyl carrier protein phosphodiesterase